MIILYHHTKFSEYLTEHSTSTNFLLLTHTDLDGYGPEIIMTKAIQNRMMKDKLFTVHLMAGKSLDEFIENQLIPKTITSSEGPEVKICIDKNALNGKYYLTYALKTIDSKKINTKTNFNEYQNEIIPIDCIIITDLFPQNYASINKLRYIQNTYEVPYFIFDHHKSALDIYKENLRDNIPDDQITIEPFETDRRSYRIFNGKPCGTSLFAEALIEYFDRNLSLPSYQIYNFVELIRQWDTWAWKNDDPNNPNIKAKTLNTLFNMIDHPEFISTCITNITDIESIIGETSSYKTLLDYSERLLQKNIKDAKTNGIRNIIIGKDDKIYTALINQLYNSSVGEISDAIFDDIYFSDIDVCIFIGFRGVSFRSRNGIDEPFDCASFAESLGGGGHKNSAGVGIIEHEIFFNKDGNKKSIKISMN